MSSPIAQELDLLLRSMHTPTETGLPNWERLLRLARMTGLHGRLAAANPSTPLLPAPVRRHLVSAQRISQFNAQMLRAELHALAPLCDSTFPVIALKGSAYALQKLTIATGRFVSDIDLLVPRANLRTMEQRLQNGGWQAAALDAYDERYYRDWSHETPPMRFPGHFLEVDLHHAITPVTAALRFDPAPLFEASIAVPNSPFRVLAPEDQVLHACLHCFQDGDLDLRLRELVDIDLLLRDFGSRDGFWTRLSTRAADLGLQRPLWYGLHYVNLWMGTAAPLAALTQISAPHPLLVRSMNALVSRAMLPSDPDFPPPMDVRLSRLAMLTRYHLLRMPLTMLVPHLARKAWLRSRARLTPSGQPPANEAGGC